MFTPRTHTLKHSHHMHTKITKTRVHSDTSERSRTNNNETTVQTNALKLSLTQLWPALSRSLSAHLLAQLSKTLKHTHGRRLSNRGRTHRRHTRCSLADTLCENKNSATNAEHTDHHHTPKTLAQPSGAERCNAASQRVDAIRLMYFGERVRTVRL